MKLLADENIKRQLVRGMQRRKPDLDIVQARDVALLGRDDPAVLEWAANEGRVLITHDIRTMPDFAYQRVVQGQPMPGVIVIRWSTPVGQAIEELLILVGACLPDELEGRVVHLPLR